MDPRARSLNRNQQPLRVLHVEDSEDDAALVLRELRRGGYDPTYERVETRAAMEAALARQPWDLVLSDYVLPNFDALAALLVLRSSGHDLPFIVVSGAVGEEVAVAAMKAGAHDYVMKGNLTRLTPAIDRELRDAEDRRERRRAEAALRESEQRFAAFMRHLPGVAFIKDDQGRYVYVNEAAERLSPLKAKDWLGKIDDELWPPMQAAQFKESHRHVIDTGQTVRTTRPMAHDSGVDYWLDIEFPIFESDGSPRMEGGLALDVTERKRLEEENAALLEAATVQAQVSGALARVGQVLISSLGTPTLLDQLCRVTTEVLQCDWSHTALWQLQNDAFVPVAGYGHTLDQWESVRALRLPRAVLTDVLTTLDRDQIVNAGISSRLACHAIPTRYGVTVGLLMALRRGDHIVGIHAATYRGRQEPFTPQQERIARGIAQLASFALENARLVEQLERANRLKSDFLATMSHELRTPLHIIIGYNDLLLDNEFGPLSAEQIEPLERMKANAGQLLELVNATLDVGRLEAGRIPIDWREVDVASLLGELDAETRELQAKPGVAVVWDVSDDVPRLCTDAAKLKVVLKNLISNAFRFTEQGSVTIRARERDRGVEIAVTDTGIGLAPDVLPIIFEPFRQGESTTVRRYDGVGLGLYIVRRLLDLLGGTISVDCAVGRGSTFRVWMPSSAAGLHAGGGSLHE